MAEKAISGAGGQRSHVKQAKVHLNVVQYEKIKKPKSRAKANLLLLGLLDLDNAH